MLMSLHLCFTSVHFPGCDFHDVCYPPTFMFVTIKLKLLNEHKFILIKNFFRLQAIKSYRLILCKIVKKVGEP